MINDLTFELKTYCNGAYVHAPIQTNSPYIEMVRRSIYKTRWLKHPHLIFLPYKKRPQGPAAWPDTAQTMYMSKATFTVLLSVTIIMNRKHADTKSIARPLSRLTSRRVPRHQHQKFHTTRCLRLDLTQGFRQDLTQVFLNRFKLRFSTGSDWSFTNLIGTKVVDWIRLSFPELIWLMLFDGIWLIFFQLYLTPISCVYSWFNSHHLGHIPVRIQESHIEKGVFKIIQH